MLAGGASSRFGRDKLAEPYRGMPLLHHAVIRLADVCGDVVVVLGLDAPEPSMPVGAPVRFARDAAEHEGPLAGAYSGLRAVRTEHAVLAGGDMPDPQAAVLLEMLRVAAEATVDAIALEDERRARPLPSVVRVDPAIQAARALLDEGHRRLRDLLHALRLGVVDERTWHGLDPDRRTLFDVDEPADLQR